MSATTDDPVTATGDASTDRASLSNDAEGVRVAVHTRPCPVCTRPGIVFGVPLARYRAWQTGKALIQEALPELSADDREMLITGTHARCWDDLYGDDDDE